MSTPQFVATSQLADQLKIKWRTPLLRHQEHLRQRRAGISLERNARGLLGLDLKLLFAPLPQQAYGEAKQLLERVAALPSGLWYRELSREARSAATPALRQAAALAAERLLGKKALDPEQVELALKVGTFELAGKLLQHYQHQSLAGLLPERLPRMTQPLGLRNRLRWLKSLRFGDTKGQYLAFEAELLRQRRELDPLDQWQATELAADLNNFKAAWGPAWLEQRRTRFAKEPLQQPGLRAGLDLGTTVEGSEREALLGRLDEAWKKISAVVHPELLKAAGAPKIVIDPQAPTPAYDPNKGTITLRPGDEVSSIIHEYGHHLEHSGVRTMAIPQLLRLNRALNGFDEYVGGIVTFKGPFLDPYMARHYPFVNGTELLSVGLRRLTDPKTAPSLLEGDALYLLRLLALLQQPGARGELTKTAEGAGGEGL